MSKVWSVLARAPYLLAMTAIVVLACLGGILLIERMMWESSLEGASFSLGFAFARDAYERGDRKLYEISLDGFDYYSGRKEGEFEIWYRPAKPIFRLPLDLLERPMQTGERAYVEGWNLGMKCAAERDADDRETQAIVPK